MKAMVLEAAKTPFVMKDVPDPVAGPGEAVARVLACGSGLTIQHFKAGRVPADFPRIIGHEITAEVVEIGPGVSNLDVGDAVTAYYYLNCGHCWRCLAGLEPLCDNPGGNVGKQCDGGYAEFIKLPAHIFVRLPAELDHRSNPAEIGVISDAIATPLKVLRRAEVKPGETVAVIGAGGGVGIHQVMMARWARARVIAVERRQEKFSACRDAGADNIIDTSSADIRQALLDLTNGDGVDVVIDYVSTAGTLESGAGALGKRGRLVTLGGAGQTFQADAMALLRNEQAILGSRYVSRNDITVALQLVARGEIKPLVTDIRPLEEAEALHEKLERGEVTGRAALLIS